MSNVANDQFFWDDFARDYYDIQQESFTTIVSDITNYLKDIDVLPCRMIVDIAGGYGKYMEAFLPYVSDYTLVDFSSEMLSIAKEHTTSKNVHYIQAEQSVFCMNSSEEQYDIVYSAMNPALTTIESIKQFYRIAKKEVILVHMKRDADSIFSPIEEVVQHSDEPSIFYNEVKAWMNESAIAWHSTLFSYEEEVEVDKAFVLEYFSEEQALYPQVNTRINQLFNKHDQLVNKHNIQFELIRIMKQ